MEAVISYINALKIEEVYFFALILCLLCSIKITKVFQLALISVGFSAISKLFLFDFLYDLGPSGWVIGWSVYELLMIASIIACRLFVNSVGAKFILSDIILIAGSVVQIFVFTLTYVAKSLGSNAMDIVYAATAPTLYVVTIFVLAFPSIYKFIGYLQGLKELNSGSSNHKNNRSTRGVFSARMRRVILGV